MTILTQVKQYINNNENVGIKLLTYNKMFLICLFMLVKFINYTNYIINKIY